MKTQLMTITPQLAREFLEHNAPKNRRIRPNKVAQLLAAFKRGEYVTTHQGVAFNEAGELIDGQHRLAAIAQMPEDFSVAMLVSTGVKDAAFRVMDTHSVRKHGDLLQVERRYVEPATFLAGVVAGTDGHVTATYVEPFLDVVRPALEELFEHCGATARLWSSASVRAAAAFSMLTHEDGTYVKTVYRAMVVGDVRAMNRITLSLWRSGYAGRLTSYDRMDLFCRALRVFEPANSELQKVQIKDSQFAVDAVRQYFAQHLPHSERVVRYVRRGLRDAPSYASLFGVP